MASGRGGPSTERREAVAFRWATTDDLAAVLDLLTEAAEWARARGVRRWWPAPFPESWVRPSVERHEVLLGVRSGEVVGTLTLTREDRRMWGDPPAGAGYVHRLAVRRRCAGERLGEQLLRRADEEVRSWGQSRLRLDCLAENDRLVRYYLELGFRVVARTTGKIPSEERTSLLLERPVAGTPRAAPGRDSAPPS